MTEAWRNIDWDEIDTGYTYGTHADDSGLVKDQLKSALFDEYEKVLQMHHDRVQNDGLEGSIPSAATPDIGAKIENVLLVTGTVDITGFVTADAGATRKLVFADILTLTDGATLKIYPSLRENIVTAAGDWATVRSRGSGDWEVVDYQRADGSPMAGVLQEQEATISSKITITAAISYDDTPPQKTQGGEVLTVDITPKYSNSILIIEALVQTYNGGNTRAMIAALFKDDDTNCMKSSVDYIPTATKNVVPLPVSHRLVSGGTSQITFKLRAGAHTGTSYVNTDHSANNLMGGTFDTHIRVREIKVS